MSSTSCLTAENNDQPRLDQSKVVAVLFLDIVGFSKLDETKQVDALRRLQNIVRATEAFSLRAESKLIVRATGDGMALVFFTDNAVCAVDCARQIALGIAEDASIDSHTAIPVRMGIHMGPVFRVTDINEEMNVAGEGINTAQRVMDCGDAGHILLSNMVTPQLRDEAWTSKLHNLGTVSVKHGQRIHLFNLYDEQIGTKELPLKIQNEIQAAAGTKQRPKLSTIMIAGGALALVILLGASLYARLRQPAPNPVIPLDESVALIPFKNETGDENLDYLPRQIQSEVYRNLSRKPRLTLIPDAITRRYRDNALEVQQIASNLGARWVLVGALRQIGDRWKLQTQLHDLKTGNRQPYEIDLGPSYRTGTDTVLTIGRTELVGFVSQLAFSITGQPKSTDPVEQYTQSKAAYGEYLKGRDYMERRGPGDYGRAFNCFTKAKNEDKSFALAYVGLAHYYLTTGGSFPAITFEEARKNAWENLDAAENLDRTKTLAEKYAVRAMVNFWFERRWRLAEDDFIRALVLDPRLLIAHRWYAAYLMAAKRWDEALIQINQSSDLEPHDHLVNNALVQYYYFQNKNDEARNACDDMINENLSPQYSPAYRYRGLALEQIGDYDEAEKALQTAINTSTDPATKKANVDDLVALGHLYGIWGKRDAALAVVARLDSQDPDNPGKFPIARASIFMGIWQSEDKTKEPGLTDRKQIVDLLETAARSRNDVRLSWLELDPRYKKFLCAPENRTLRESLWTTNKLSQLELNSPNKPTKCQEH